MRKLMAPMIALLTAVAALAPHLAAAHPPSVVAIINGGGHSQHG